jgi:DNA-binding CsgD family transcriptional regulator
MAQATRLSTRERAVVELLLVGKSNKQIALALGISARTVEFHLRNIYIKFNVGSRIEFILKLGDITGSTVDEKLGYSAVEKVGKKAENKYSSNSKLDWTTSSKIGKELEMNTLSKVTPLLVGGMTAVLAGFAWIALFIYYGNLTVNGTKEWAIPLMIILAILGGSVGLIARRSHNTLGKVLFSTLLGTSLSFFSIIPIMLIVVLPLEKLIIRFGLPDPFASSKMASDVSNFVGTITMMVIWLIVGIGLGTTLLFLSIRKRERVDTQPLSSS